MARKSANPVDRAKVFVRTWASGHVGKLSSASFSSLHVKLDPSALTQAVAEKAAQAALANRTQGYKQLSPGAEEMISAIPQAVIQLMEAGEIQLTRSKHMRTGAGSYAMTLAKKEWPGQTPEMRLMAYARGHANRVAIDLTPDQREDLAQVFRRCSELRRPRSSHEPGLVIQGLQPTEQGLLLPEAINLDADLCPSLSTASLLVVDSLTGRIRLCKAVNSVILSDQDRMVIQVDAEEYEHYTPSPITGLVPQIRLVPPHMDFTFSPDAFRRFGTKSINVKRFILPLRRPYPGANAAACAMLFALLPKAAWKAAQSLARVNHMAEWNLFCPQDPVRAARRWQAMASMPMAAKLMLNSFSSIDSEYAFEHRRAGVALSHDEAFAVAFDDENDVPRRKQPSFDKNAIARLIDAAEPLMPELQVQMGLRQGILRRLLPQKWQRTGAAIQDLASQARCVAFLDAIPPDKLPTNRSQWKTAQRIASDIRGVTSLVDLDEIGQSISTRAWRNGWDLSIPYEGGVSDFLSGVARSITEHVWHAAGNAGGYFGTPFHRHVLRMLVGRSSTIMIEDLMAGSSDWHANASRIARRMSEINQAAAARRMGLEVPEAVPLYLAPGGDWVMPPAREGEASLGSMRWLRCVEDLEAETAVMGHCVYSYAHQAMQGSMLAAVRAGDGSMSTVELVLAPLPQPHRDGLVVTDPIVEARQNRAQKNADPSQSCTAIVQAWLRQVGSRLDRDALNTEIAQLKSYADRRGRVMICPEDYARTLGSVLDLYKRYLHRDHKNTTPEQLIDLALTVRPEAAHPVPYQRDTARPQARAHWEAAPVRQMAQRPPVARELAMELDF